MVARKLLKLYKNKEIKRDRNFNGEFVYFLKKMPEQLRHLDITINTIIDIMEKYRNNNQLYGYGSFDFKVDIERSFYDGKNVILRADGMLQVKSLTGSYWCYLIETDCSSNSAREKIEKYNQLFESNHEWKPIDYFPTVIIVTHRAETFERFISNSEINQNGINFKPNGIQFKTLTIL